MHLSRGFREGTAWLAASVCSGTVSKFIAHRARFNVLFKRESGPGPGRGGPAGFKWHDKLERRDGARRNAPGMTMRIDLIACVGRFLLGCPPRQRRPCGAQHRHGRRWKLSTADRVSPFANVTRLRDTFSRVFSIRVPPRQRNRGQYLFLTEAPAFIDDDETAAIGW